MSRFWRLSIALVVALVTTFSWGIAPALAQQDQGAPNQAAQEALAKQRAAADAAEARRLRDEAWQRRKAMREYVEQHKQEQQPGAGPAAPGNSGKDGAK